MFLKSFHSNWKTVISVFSELISKQNYAYETFKPINFPRGFRHVSSLANHIILKVFLLIFSLWGTMGFAQNTYIDPTVTAAMILYSENLKAKQNEVIEETSKLKDAQTWVGTQMVAANDIQNKILKGLKEVSGTLQNESKHRKSTLSSINVMLIHHKWYN